jgi:hypothetical protein
MRCLLSRVLLFLLNKNSFKGLSKGFLSIGIDESGIIFLYHLIEGEGTILINAKVQK